MHAHLYRLGTEPAESLAASGKKTNQIQRSIAFNNSERFPEGWYWLLRSADLKKGKVKATRLLGRDLVAYRGEDGLARVMDAYCPHMGAHLAEGKVEGNSVRCFFHHWKLNEEGKVTDIPCLKSPVKAGIPTWHAREEYGLIWVWAGEGKPRYRVPFIPELEHEEVESRLGGHFVKGCHPNVVMVNAIDEQHFHSVHPLASSLAAGLEFGVVPFNENAITFSNTKKVPKTNPLFRLLGKLYSGPLTYKMCYWNGTTGSVTVGPDAIHFHIIFALRPTPDGKTEGQTILVTKKHKGLPGSIINKVALRLSGIVGDYFAQGDTQVFETIKWNFQTPVKPDHSIVKFIQHLDGQRMAHWESWAPVGNKASPPRQTVVLSKGGTA